MCENHDMSADLPETSAFAASSSGAVDAPPASGTLTAEGLSLPADLLDGGEVVVLAIKPALWSVLFNSAQWLAAGAVLIALGWFAAAPAFFSRAALVQAVLAVVGLRLGFAVMQWVSRVYVLTNRRVMRIRGVLRVDVFACPLVKIINTGVIIRPHEAATRLGSIWFNTGEEASEGTWYHVARPHEVHAEIRKAVERALDHH